MLGAVGWVIDSNRISHDQLEKNCPPEAQIAVGPKNMNDQLALHNIPRYTYYHLSNNVQTMFRLLMLRIIYIYAMHVQTLSVFFLPTICQPGRWLDMSDKNHGIPGCQWDIPPMLPCHIIRIQ